MPINHLLTDKRIQKQALAQGLLKQSELDQLLASLPDLRDQVATDDDGTRSETTSRQDV